MKLADRIKVNTRYTRSANVERDSGAVATVSAYCPTSRGLALLEDVASALGGDNTPRAWSLIGPYGSGKSTFGVFLHALLGAGNAASVEAAKVVGRQSRSLATRFRRQKPWCRVALTGSPEPLSRRLLTALDAAAAAFWEGRSGRKPRVLQDIRDACAKKQVPESHLLTLVDRLQAALERVGAGGLLLVIDELGKFLEFEAREREGNMGSTYLLQELAERSYTGRSTGRKANLMLFVLQHQSFDMYAAGMGEQLQNEWAKVQGRFQTVSFVETTEQTLRVLAAAFEHDLTELEQNGIRQWSAKSAKALADAKALPVGLAKDAAAQLFTACYPMHPIALLALPVLCTRFAQNERTLFSYFGSNEPHGFRQAVERLEHLGEWVRPSDVFDYFVQTQPPTLAAPLAQRTWAEVVTAVDRAERTAQETQVAGRASGSLTALVKSVGLLNLTTGSQGLQATQAVLGQLFKTKQAFKQALAAPLAASILQYRKFADEYRVWQGTDFNIDEHVARERDKLGRVDLARTLTERGETAPIVARRHSIETGALRCFKVVYADAGTTRPKEDGGPAVVFFLAEKPADEALFHAARKDARAGEVWVLHTNGAALRAAIVDVLALERVQQGAQEVASDPVAAREVKEQLKTARAVERQALNAILRDPAASDWHWGRKQLRVSDRRTLQAALSNVMDRIYPHSPKVRNELINRDRLSSQAAAARNKLFAAMLDRADQPGLGIAKYPPERAIYRSVLERGGLHAKDESGKWKLAPPPDEDALRLKPAWARLDALFEASEALPVSAEQLMEGLAAPPIGMKRGLFPLFFLHYYLLNRHEIAFYDEGAYSPTLAYEHLERLVRRPDLFAFQRFRVAGVRASLFNEYSQALFGEKRQVALLELARPLASFLLGLPDYAQKTRRLSEPALRVRQALTLAKSPEKLLFKDLPEACGYGGATKPEGFAEHLISALREMNGAYATMLDEMRTMLCGGFGCPADTQIGELRSVAMGRCHGLDRYTVDVKGLKSFIRRAMERGRSDEDWLEYVLTFLGQKPPSKWTDQDRSTAEYRLAEFSARLRDLQRLKLYYDERGESAADGMDVILLKTLSRDQGEIDEAVPIDGHVAKAIADAKRRVDEVLNEVGDDKLRLALVAWIAQDCLAERRRANTANAADGGSERGLRRVG